MVRPLAGAGIEIAPPLCLMSLSTVRPLAGAGIEITNSATASKILLFAPSRGRELKYL